MRAIGRTSRWVFALATAALWMGVVCAATAALAAEPAPQEAGEEDEDAQKEEWQERYRALRNNSVRMRDNAIKLRRAYSLSQHSNYPRGGARERFKQQVLDTERKADEYEAQLAEFLEEARANQIPPGWIYQVDDEPVDPGTPAAFDDEQTHGAPPPDGRNPAYYGNDDSDYEDEEEEPEDDRGDAFDDFNDDRDDQYRARDPENEDDD